MAGAAKEEAARGAATFEAASIEARDGRLVVSGRWSGVRGMRFMRPTLVLGDRQLLAVLEHKPWAPDADPWTAAFPWDGGEVDPDEMALSVAPSIMVPLGDRVAAVEDEPATADEDALALQRLQAEVRFLRDERRDNQAAVMDRDDLERARREAERERDNALAQLQEAIADREAAVRTRNRMEAQRDEAEEARRAAEAERDDVLEHIAELRAHLDQVLMANRELQQQLQTQLAAAAPAEPVTRPAPPRPAPREGDDEEPIGVRAIPAARAVSPELHRSQRARDVGASPFDVWAIRVLGTAAAICFILLLVMFLSLFV